MQNLLQKKNAHFMGKGQRVTSIAIYKTETGDFFFFFGGGGGGVVSRSVAHSNPYGHSSRSVTWTSRGGIGWTGE